MTEQNNALDALYGKQKPAVGIEAIAEEFIETLNTVHSKAETWDNALDTQIHKWYADAPNVFPKKPYYSPSSANSCPRELYMKAIGAKKDAFPKPPYQGRWQSIGTKIGDIIQRDLLYAERNMRSRFRFEKDAEGRPMFEEFAKTNKAVTHDGHTFYLFGLPDGIMEYVQDDGSILRVGLEVKSKQTTSARTSLYSMREPDAKHVKQTIAYSEMYSLDHFIILYVNASKKGWVISEEDAIKTPDIRAFGLTFTDDDRAELFDSLTVVSEAVRTKTPPPMDLANFTFNNFKTACALSLTDEEYTDIKTQVKAVSLSGLSDKVKRDYREALDFITVTRTKTRQGGGQ